jgi:hypothetical protein
MTVYEKRTRFVLLSCLHKVELSEPIPAVGAEQYCIRDGSYHTVTMHLTNYRAKCKSCRGSRNTGDDQVMAEVWAKKHIVQNPRHTVTVSRDAQRLKEFTNVEEVLFASGEELRETAANAQGILRKSFPDAVEVGTYEGGRFPF